MSVLLLKKKPPELEALEEQLEQEELLKWHFPTVEAGGLPLGERVLVQLRSVKKMSKGGIVLPEEAREAEKYNTNVAKVVALGPLAYRKRDTLELWAEGVWASVGQYVRVPKFGGDRWEVDVPGRDEPALFATFRDHEVNVLITGNPLLMKAFI